MTGKPMRAGGAELAVVLHRLGIIDSLFGLKGARRGRSDFCGEIRMKIGIERLGKMRQHARQISMVEGLPVAKAFRQVPEASIRLGFPNWLTRHGGRGPGQRIPAG